jgi:hypothetical protein
MGEDGTSTRVLFVYVIWMIRHCFTDKVVQLRQIAGFSGTFLVIQRGKQMANMAG